MIVTIEFKGINLQVEIVPNYPTFEEENLCIEPNPTIESIKLEDSEIDIQNLFDLDLILELL
jgi:hypothetical protein